MKRIYLIEKFNFKVGIQRMKDISFNQIFIGCFEFIRFFQSWNQYKND